MIDIEDLLRVSDPIGKGPLPSADSRQAQQLFHAITEGTRGGWRPRRPAARVTVAFSVVAIVGLAVALIVTLLPGSPLRPDSAAAAVLDQAANGAAQQQPLTIGPGQYLYWETTGTQGVTILGLPTGQIATYYLQTNQEWIAANGAERVTHTYKGPVRFDTPASEQNWIAAGRPATILDTPAGPNGGTKTTTEPPGSATFLSESTLPTTSGALLKVIEAGKTGDPNMDHQWITDDGPAGIFRAAADLLAWPATGTSPALRSALYEIMAGLPGVTLLGTVTDHSGQSGIAIAGPAADGTRPQVVIDPKTGQLLEEEQVIVNPAAESAGVRKYFGDTPGQVTYWTDITSTGIVSSLTATP